MILRIGHALFSLGITRVYIFTVNAYNYRLLVRLVMTLEGNCGSWLGSHRVKAMEIDWCLGMRIQPNSTCLSALLYKYRTASSRNSGVCRSHRVDLCVWLRMCLMPTIEDVMDVTSTNLQPKLIIFHFFAQQQKDWLASDAIVTSGPTILSRVRERSWRRESWSKSVPPCSFVAYKGLLLVSTLLFWTCTCTLHDCVCGWTVYKHGYQHKPV